MRMSDFNMPVWIGGALSFFNWDELHAVFGAIAAFISIGTFGVRQWMKRKNAERSLSEAEKLIAEKQKKLDIIEKAANSHETHLWDLWPKDVPSWFREKWLKSSLRVLLLANFKGGVGK